jgi:hypothetical protein
MGPAVLRRPYEAVDHAKVVNAHNDNIPWWSIGEAWANIEIEIDKRGRE